MIHKTNHLALRTETSISKELLLEVVEHDDTTRLSDDAQALRNELVSDTTDCIDEGENHDEWEWNHPCPNCGSDELIMDSIIDDTYVVDGEHAEPVSHGAVHGNPMVICADCSTTLYRRTGHQH